MSLAAENHYQPGPAIAVLSRAVFWAVPETAKEVFLDLIEAVNVHAPTTLTIWLEAACTGLAARGRVSAIPDDAKSLAEAASARIHADDEVRARLISTAEMVAQADQSIQPDAA